MELKEALSKEIRRLERVELDIARKAQKEGNLHLGAVQGSVVKNLSESYKRILKDLK